LTKEQLSTLKNKLCKKHGLAKPPTDIAILLHADPSDLIWLKKKVLTKPVRTQSGVSVVAIMSYPFPCPHGACTMCPTMVSKGIPMSYTGKEPATLRGLRNKWDAYMQVFNRLEQYVVTGHTFDKVEVIIMGGTFLSFSQEYKTEFIRDLWQAMNDFSTLFVVDGQLDIEKFKDFFELPGDINNKEREARIQAKMQELKKSRKTTVEAEKKYNDEESFVKGIGLTIETKPDWGLLKEGNEMLEYGVTRVELGVQSVYEDVLERIHRGHTLQDTVDSIRILRDLGFKLNFHMMPGLPGVDKKRDIEGLKQIFSDSRFVPDMLKIYPCMVSKYSALYKDWKEGNFIPLSTEEAAEMITQFTPFIPEYCRVMRVQRDIPTYMTEAGVDRTNLRQYVDVKRKELGITCKCIRCREIKTREVEGEVEYKVYEYENAAGKDYFISANIEEYILGFCRLRFPSESVREEIPADGALIRELHVYGTAVKIGSSGDKVQHRGVGKTLMKMAEEIAVSHNKSKMVVLSGVGVRGYYRKLGYSMEGPYMVKKF